MSSARLRARSLFVVLLALQSLLPSAAATHLLRPSPSLPMAPDIPETPVKDPGVAPIDRRLHEISGALHTINATVKDQYEVINQTYKDTRSGLPPEPIQLFTDGAGSTESGPDASIGGRGDWDIMGTDDWARSGRSAHAGVLGFTSSKKPDGTYNGSASSVLLSPALDLRTGFVDPVLGSVRPPAPLDKLVGDLLTVSGVYRALFDTVEKQVLNRGPNNVIGQPPQTGRHQGNPGDSLYELGFDVRYNLASGQDVVRVYVFNGSAPPVRAPTPKSCPGMQDPFCALVTPTEGYSQTPQRPISATDPSTAFTGFSEWKRVHVDLTP
jgi:hypothetical protein